MGHPTPQDPGGPILIGLRDLYAQLQHLDRTITGLSAQIQMAAQQQTLQTASTAQQIADMRHDMNDHETRIRAQEARQVVSPRGMWTALAVILPMIASIVTIILTLALG